MSENKDDKTPSGGEVLANLISIDGLVSDLDGEARGEYGVSVHLREGGAEALAVWAETYLEVRQLDAEENETCPECHIMSEHADGCSLVDPTGGER